MIKTDVPFLEQVAIFSRELSQVFDYLDLDGIHAARGRMWKANQIVDEDLMICMSFASYVGSLIRINYYRYVHKLGFDVRALFDASIIMFMFNGVYQFEFENFIKDKNVKEVMQKTRYPKWTKIGLLGGSTSEWIKLGDEFSEYMDGLED